MGCTEYREVISAYVDDELARRDLKALLEHLKLCAECRAEVATLTLQKQEIRSAISAHQGVLPDTDFSAKVMAEIDKISVPSHSSSLVEALLSGLSRFFPGNLRAPAYAVSLGVVLIVAVSGIGILTKDTAVRTPPQKELMNVYELQAQGATYRSHSSSAMERNGESIVYQHLAYSSAETIGTEPCVLEYAAYTSATAE